MLEINDHQNASLREVTVINSRTKIVVKILEII